jgi:predicted lipoprotein with Yx(FWY)xxD motif
VRSLTPHPSPRAGRLLGAVVTVAALGVAASVAVLGITSAYGGHSAHDASPAAAVSAPAAGDQAAAGGHDMGGMDTGGTDAAGGSAEDAGGMPGMGSGGVELYAVQTGTLGIVATDGAGRLLYGSAADGNNPPTSRCTGACAQEWQPVVVPKGQQPQLLGVDAKQVGSIGREDGSSQLTLGGWPIYVNRDDDGALRAAAPAAHGSWFVMTPQGGKVAI